jgi:transposase InsO family protein
MKTFIRRAQMEFRLPIKKVQSDNGTKFRNTNVEEFLDEEGIKHEFSTPYTLNKMGWLRGRTVLIDMARTILDEYKTPDNYWA